MPKNTFSTIIIEILTESLQGSRIPLLKKRTTLIYHNVNNNMLLACNGHHLTCKSNKVFIIVADNYMFMDKLNMGNVLETFFNIQI